MPFFKMKPRRMRNPFRKKDVNIVDPGATPFKTLPTPGYEQVWERKAMPDPGAQNYAFETLQLAPFTPIGPTERTRQPLVPTSPQIYVNYGALLSGMGTIAGQMVGQPLFDPNVPGNGYTSGNPNSYSPLAFMNIPADRSGPLPTNSTAPDRLRAQ